MNHARLALAGWMVLNLAGVAPRAMAQEVKNQGPVVCGRGAQRTIVDTVVTGSVDARTLRAALEVLPRRPKRIDVVDDQDLPAAVLKEVAGLDAFVLTGTQTIYLRRQSRTLREAEYAGGPDTLMLAVVIWHEMAHAEGLDERGARRREEELWKEFVRNGRVEGGTGLSYLRELQARR